MYASAHHHKVGNAIAITTFTVAYLKRQLRMWFEYPYLSAVITQELNVTLVVGNIGNGTAYTVNVTMDIPDGLVVISANSTYMGNVDPGETLILTATDSQSQRTQLTRRLMGRLCIPYRMNV